MELTRFMRRHSPEWTDLFEDGSTTHAEKGRLVLNAANFLENERIDSQHDYRVRNAVRILSAAGSKSCATHTHSTAATHAV